MSLAELVFWTTMGGFFGYLLAMRDFLRRESIADQDRWAELDRQYANARSFEGGMATLNDIKEFHP